MDFEEWYREAKKTNNCGFTAKDFFEAGQQSKQAEIDAIKNILSDELEYDEVLIEKIKELLK